MKRRIPKTYTILAVALTAAGCTETAPDTNGPQAAPNPGEQQGTVPAAARPIRDADGYPVVGNVIRKGGAPKPRDAGADADPGHS